MDIKDKPAKEDKKLKLFNSQKNTLDILFEHHAITKEQYDFSLNGLKVKMNIEID